MKTQILVPVVLLIIIAILVGSLVHVIAQTHRAWRGERQFQLAAFVQLYQILDRGEVDAAKRRLGALVTVESDAYQRQYGQETGTKFAPMFAQAKAIEAEFKATQ